MDQKFFDFHAWVKKYHFGNFPERLIKSKKGETRIEQGKKRQQEGPSVYYVSKGTGWMDGWVGGWAQKMASFEDVHYFIMLT